MANAACRQIEATTAQAELLVDAIRATECVVVRRPAQPYSDFEGLG